MSKVDKGKIILQLTSLSPKSEICIKYLIMYWWELFNPQKWVYCCLSYRIVGDCVSGHVPWYALLVLPYDGAKCGGAIINKFWVLTAAHCLCNGADKCKKRKRKWKLDYNVKNIGVRIIIKYFTFEYHLRLKWNWSFMRVFMCPDISWNSDKRRHKQREWQILGASIPPCRSSYSSQIQARRTYAKWYSVTKD